MSQATLQNRSGDPSLLRRLNVAAALQAFIAHPSLTLRDLRSSIGVSRPTAEEISAHLLAKGLIEEDDPQGAAEPGQPGARSVGRPARHYRLSRTAGAVAGFDIGAHKVGCVVSDLRGGVLAARRVSVPATARPSTRFKVAREALDECLSEAGLLSSHVSQAACGITGAFRTDDDRVRDVLTVKAGSGVHTSSLPGFASIDVADELSQALGMAVEIRNDIHLAVLGEHWRGAANGTDDVVYMHAGRRLGVGILIGGRVHSGRHGLAGMVGTLRAMGWPEAMAELNAAACALAGTPSRTEASDRALRHLLDAARTGADDRAQSAVEGVAAALARGAAALVQAIDPELVVVGGGLSRAGDLVREPFVQELRELSIVMPEVALSTLGEEAVAIGATHTALDRAHAQLTAVEA